MSVLRNTINKACVLWNQGRTKMDIKKFLISFLVTVALAALLVLTCIFPSVGVPGFALVWTMVYVIIEDFFDDEDSSKKNIDRKDE